MVTTPSRRYKWMSKYAGGPGRGQAIRNAAVRWCPEASGTPASRAAPARISLVCDTGRQGQSGPAPQARCFFQVQLPLATLPRQWRCLQPATRLCPTSIASPAYQASVHSIVSAQEARRALSLAGATLHPAGRRPQRYPGATCTPREIRPPPLAIARSWHKPGRVPNGVPVALAATATLPDTPSRPAASGAGRNSFPQAPDAPAQNPDGWQANYLWRPSIAGRSRGRG